MKYFLIMFFIFLIKGLLYSQDRPQYDISLIPDSLKKSVNSVIREESIIFTIKKPGRGKEVIKKVVTVFNEKAESELIFYDYYDEFRKIDDIEINVYDEKGKYLKRSRKRDLHTQSVGDGISLVNDTKIIYASLSTDKYPITIEINYEINFGGILELPDFFPQTTDQSILLNYYSITTDTANSIRYKNYRCDIKPEVRINGDQKTVTWEVKNVQPFQKEPGSAQEDVPRVQISPTFFEMDNYPGNMSSWKSYGDWISSLNRKVNSIPEQRVSFYRDLVKNAKTDREKVAILYKHLQENYRYVSIQLGIGGHKPFPAEFVEKKKYGDCKALSNFMSAVLNTVNIKSYYTVINSGYNSMPVDQDFPQDAFNHIILCVPFPKDTIWLECTSRTQPFGKLGNFTENRYGVLVTENGGVLVRTPSSKAEDNIMHSKTFIDLNEDGSGKASVDITHSGEYSDLSNFILESEDQQKKNYLINKAGFKQMDEIQISKRNSISSNDYTLHYEMAYEKVPDFSAGSKLFLSSRLYKIWNKALPKSEKRQNDYYLEFPLIQSDSTIYQLPDGFIAETIPKPANIKYAFGSFQTNYVFDAEKRQLITTGTIKIDKHIIPASRYQEAAQFFSDVIKEQQQKIVVRKE